MVLVTELIKNIISKRILNIEYSDSCKYYDLHTAMILIFLKYSNKPETVWGIEGVRDDRKASNKMLILGTTEDRRKYLF